jgi:hypothetical protein
VCASGQTIKGSFSIFSPLRIDPMYDTKKKYQICSLCNEPVELETTKTDESGKPVHEECYVIALKKKHFGPPAA